MKSLISLCLLTALVSPTLAQTWEIEVVDNPRDFSNPTSKALRLDASNHPHIAVGGDHLYHISFDGLTWDFEVADSCPNCWDASLAMDTSGYPHISYFEGHNRDLKYAYKDATGWHLQVVDELGDVGRWTSVALDFSGYPHIGYYDNTNFDLKYAYEDVTGWHG